MSVNDVHPKLKTAGDPDTVSTEREEISQNPNRFVWLYSSVSYIEPPAPLSLVGHGPERRLSPLSSWV